MLIFVLSELLTVQHSEHTVFELLVAQNSECHAVVLWSTHSLGKDVRFHVFTALLHNVHHIHLEHLFLHELHTNRHMLEFTMILSWVVTGSHHSRVVFVDDGWVLLFLSEIGKG